MLSSDKRDKTFRLALLSVLAALTMALSFMEAILPPLAFFPAGFKIGVSNIAVMYALFCLSVPHAIILSVVKSLFVLFISGGYAFSLSLLGSIMSVVAMAVAIKIFKSKISYSAVSVIGALFHNGAQLLLVCVITASTAAIYYSPLLIIAAVICGFATAAILRACMPTIEKFSKR